MSKEKFVQILEGVNLMFSCFFKFVVNVAVAMATIGVIKGALLLLASLMV